MAVEVVAFVVSTLNHTDGISGPLALGVGGPPDPPPDVGEEVGIGEEVGVGEGINTWR